jgi:hypothetical protein
MRKTTALAVTAVALAAAIIFGPMLASAAPGDAPSARFVKVQRTGTLDFEPVTIDESSVTQITDLARLYEVQVTNDTTQDVCIAVDSVTPFDCASVSITCDGGTNHTIVKVGASKTWPMPESHALCAKAKAALTGKFYVEERN